MRCEASAGCRVHTLVKREWTILMRTGREERRYEFSNCSHDYHPHHITFHLLLLLNLFLAPSIPIPTLQIILTHTFTICQSCSYVRVESLSTCLNIEIYVSLSVRPSLGLCACLRPVNSIATNDGVWQAGCSSLEQTSVTVLLFLLRLKKKRVKSKYGRLSHILYLLHDCSSML